MLHWALLVLNRSTSIASSQAQTLGDVSFSVPDGWTCHRNHVARNRLIFNHRLPAALDGSAVLHPDDEKPATSTGLVHMCGDRRRPPGSAKNGLGGDEFPLLEQICSPAKNGRRRRRPVKMLRKPEILEKRGPRKTRNDLMSLE